MLKRLLTLLLTLCLFLALVPTAEAASAPTLSSTSAILYSLNSGDVIFEKNADAVLAPASLTKIVTTMVVLEMCSDLEGTYVTVPNAGLFDEIRAVGGSNIDLTVGERLSVNDLLYAVMLPSACDACSVLAYHFGNGNVQTFVERMNTWAREAGAVSTTFRNAHGLDAPGHKSSARDISKIILKALQNEKFVEIINTFEHLIPENDYHAKRYVNYQSTIPMLYEYSGEYYTGMVGIKSGYTLQAKCCLSSMATRGDETFLAVCMGAPKEGGTNHARSDTRALYDWAFANFETKTVKRAGEVIATATLSGATAPSATVSLKEDLVVCTQKDAGEVQLFPNLKNPATAPFSEEAGTLEVVQNGKVIATRTLSFDTVPTPALPQTPADTELTNDGPSAVMIVGIAALVLLAVLAAAVVLLSRPAPKKRTVARVKAPLSRREQTGYGAPKSTRPPQRPAPRGPQNNNRRQG